MKPLRILLITRECLRTDSNEGNVLLNLFSGQPVELANIYCKPGLPDTEACVAYFQLTDRMALNSLLHQTTMGQSVQPQCQECRSAGAGEQENRAFYDFFRLHNFTLFHGARELLWLLADFKSPALRNFVTDFAPDVIFAPLCYSMFVLAVHRYVIGVAQVPAVTYLYDDLYSFRQFRLSPFYWGNRLLQRHAIRKTLPCYQFTYTMTRQQAEEYARMLNIPMRLLRKGAAVPQTEAQRKPHDGVRLIYAGGIYFGRDRTLMLVAEAVRVLRSEGVTIRLDIYTSSPLTKRARSRLDHGEGCRVHPAIPLPALKQEYRESDIALHVESFQKKNALLTRLSFSTKIVDCLGSGCAVLAICPAINAGWQYLRDEDAAICVSAAHDIQTAIRALAGDPARREAYAHKARECLVRNHDEKIIQRGLIADLEYLLVREDSNQIHTDQN